MTYSILVSIRTTISAVFATKSIFIIFDLANTTTRLLHMSESRVLLRFPRVTQYRVENRDRN